MANLLTFTEQFDNADWTSNNSTVTANSGGSPPAIYGINATAPDTIADNTAAALGNLLAAYQSIPNDAAAYVGSIFVKKDAITSRFPQMGIQIAGGTTIVSSVSINTAAGTLLPLDTTPVTRGVVDVDAFWWRVWLQTANNSSGNTLIRMNIYPAATATHGDVSDNAVTGSIVAWGANITQSSSLLAYEPDPFYAFVVAETPAAIIFKNRLHV